MARRKRRKRNKYNFSLLKKKSIYKKYRIAQSNINDLLNKENESGHFSIYVNDDGEILGLGKRGRMSQEEIDELLKYMLKEDEEVASLKVIKE